eukprot:SAG31_NODE_14928_length_780_cov_1.046990_2_plen_52_part_01
MLVTVNSSSQLNPCVLPSDSSSSSSSMHTLHILQGNANDQGSSALRLQLVTR